MQFNELLIHMQFNELNFFICFIDQTCDMPNAKFL